MKTPIIQTVYVLIDERGMFFKESTETHTLWATYFLDAIHFINIELAKRYIKKHKLRYISIYKVRLEPIKV